MTEQIHVTIGQVQEITNALATKVKEKGYVTEDGLGALAKKDEIAKSDLAAALVKAIDDVVAESGQNKTAIEILNGGSAGSIKKAIDDAFDEFAAKVSDDNVVNTYKELIDYAASHGAEYTALIGEVSDLAAKLVLGKNGDGEDAEEYATVKQYVEAYVASQISSVGLSEGDGISINDGTVSAKVTAGNGLSVDKAHGIRMEAVVASTDGEGGSDGAMTAAQAEKLENIRIATEDEVKAVCDSLSID